MSAVPPIAPELVLAAVRRSQKPTYAAQQKPLTMSQRHLRHRFFGNFHSSRKTDREGRAVARLTLDRDVAAHHLAEAPAYREPKAGAAVFASRGCIGLGEFLEQFAHLLRRHAYTSVADRDRDPVAASFLPLPRVDGDGAVVGELVGVAHEVQQRLPQSHLVGMQRPDRSVTFDRDLVGILRRQRFDGLDDVVD
jgi:hypothetical protein